jgi:hypothetical protein
MAGHWYALRAVYEHSREEDGTGVFCERVLLFNADNVEAALDQAERESARYLRLNPGFRRIGEWAAFAIHKNQCPPESGAEVWAMIYLDKRSGENFYREHYKNLEMPPDDEG